MNTVQARLLHLWTHAQVLIRLAVHSTLTPSKMIRIE